MNKPTAVATPAGQRNIEHQSTSDSEKYLDAYHRVKVPVLDGDRTEDGRMAITVEEAGRLLGVGRGTIYKMSRSGALPTIPVGRRRFVSVRAIQRLLAGEDVA